MDSLGRITVFAGTHDILTPDARVLARTAGPGIGDDLREHDGATHAWMLLSEPEGVRIAAEIATVLGPGA